MWRRRAVVAVAAVLGLGLAAGLTAAPFGAPTGGEVAAGPAVAPWAEGDPVFLPPPRQPAILGANYHPLWSGMDARTRSAVLDQVQASGLEWVRLDVGWKDFQPDGPDTYDLAEGVPQVDQMIREVRSRGLKILLLFYWAPEWSSGTFDKNGRPGNADDFAAAAAWVAARYDGLADPELHIDAIELWNEPDLHQFWDKAPSSTRVSDYAELVSRAGPAVRQANPNLTIVSGAISHPDPDWFAEFYATAGVQHAYDVMGLHLYPAPSDRSPAAVDMENPTFSMSNVVAVDAIMTRNEDSARLWVTEFGWSTHGNNPLTRNWQRGVSEEEQALFLLEALAVATKSQRVEAAFWYTMWAPPTGDSHLDNYGLVAGDFRRKPAFFAMKCATNAICGPSSPTLGHSTPGQ